MTQDDRPHTRRFAIAFSFPGEHRDFVEQVAIALLPDFGGEKGKARIFYDVWHESEIIGYNSNRKLQNIYGTECDLIVPFYCQEYLDKNWCGVELRAIEQLLFEHQYERVLPFRFDMVSIPSSFKTDVFPVVSKRNPEDIAKLIFRRYSEVAATDKSRITQELHVRAWPRHHVPVDISRIDSFAPLALIGRDAEIELLNYNWERALKGEFHSHIITFVALGGEGKTSIVARWAAELVHRGLKECDGIFAWSFYSQGTRDHSSPSSDAFLKDALVFFGDNDTAHSAQGAFTKGRRLAQILAEKQAILILDGLEPLQYAPTGPTPGQLRDQGLVALLKQLAVSSRGLCVVTTRYSIPDLLNYRDTTSTEIPLLRLSKQAGIALLKALSVKGSDYELGALVDEVRGHALTINLLGTWLRDAYSGDVRKRDAVKFSEAVAEQGGHAFRVMDAYVRWFESQGEKGRRSLAFLLCMGLFDRPANIKCLEALWALPVIKNLTEPITDMSEALRNFVFTRLQDSKLIVINRSNSGDLIALDAHPLVREYFAEALRLQRPAAWHAAHRRVFEHLCSENQDKEKPELEDLQPLYQAIVHGCHAGLYIDAYRNV
jgi:hypothetical protein